ncbi:hypothetical protein K3758_05530 [Sulfitobacter sp. W002]|uniref:hypothetical protein n=1 Tax=Sulfitobacter sp. W002 TaxID=2867024 RepID=UPI0021A2FDAA|nr:hypothetical protein [Sulfitobacter sp. W002]UWR30988.1 hypothetical protein K3758_05530 [Sulfitobacter sp. W002]
MPKSLSYDEDCKQTVKLWLSDGNYYVNNCPPELSLFCQITEEIKKSMSLDAFRFAAHSAQTVFELEQTGAYPKLTSWRVIQTYYAAYFAAHAILRFFGRSFSHLENGHVNFLKVRCNSEAGYLPNLPSTYYLIVFSPEGQALSFTKCSESHKDLWKSFNDLIREISTISLTLRASEDRRQALSLIFSNLSDSLCQRGQFQSGNWLSVVRNEVNYKSSHGVWFPFSKATPSFSDLMAKVKDWRKGSTDLGNPNYIRNELERFFVTAFSVIDLGLSLAQDYQEIVEKSGRRSSDFSRLLKISAAA